MQQVEGHEDQRHLGAQPVRDHLPTQPPLEVEEGQHAVATPGQHLAVEHQLVPYPGGPLGDLREGRGGLLQVAAEELASPGSVSMQLAAHAVVFLLGPGGLGRHPLKRQLRRLHRRGQHEADGLEERDPAIHVQPSGSTAKRGLADVAGQHVHALHGGERHLEGAADGGLDEPLLEADAELQAEHLDDVAGRRRLEAGQQPDEPLLLGCGPAGASDLVEGRGHVSQRGWPGLRSALQRLEGPVAQVCVLPIQTAQIFRITRAFVR